MNNTRKLSFSPATRRLAGSAVVVRRQRGAVLIVALIILVALTAMGVSGMRTANLEEHFAGNFRDQSKAFGAAESALRYAEGWLDTLTTRALPESSCAKPPCDIFKSNALEDGYFANRGLSWWKGTSTRAYQKPTGAADLDVSVDPRFVVEELPYVPRAGDSLLGGTSGLSSGGQYYYYRITVLGQGGARPAAGGTAKANYTSVVLQSTYVSRYN